MTDLSARLDGLSREKRAALLELLRKRKEAAAGETAPPPPRAPGDVFPLSFAQQRLWFVDRLAPGSPLYNMPGVLRCTGPLAPAVLAACLSEVVRRHGALRTRFEIRGEGPVQVVEPPSPLPLPVIDLSALPEAIREPEAQRVLRAESLRPFDLRRPPLARARLLRLAAEEHLFVYVFHHIVSDGMSLEVAVREVGALYAAFVAGRPSPLPELPLQYADFAWEQVRSLRGEALEREIAWWRPRLARAPVLALPTDRPRPAVPSFGGTEMGRMLPAELEPELQELARRERVTLFIALLAPVCALLARLAGTEDVVVGTVVAGRNSPRLQGLIGFFVNTLVLRVDAAGDPDLRELLARAREVSLGAFEHQGLSFDQLVDELKLPRDPYRPPLLRVVFQLLPAPSRPFSVAGLHLEPYRRSGETSKFDLMIAAQEQWGSLRSDWSYDTDLFEAETIARWAGSFEVLLGAWLREPSLRLSELPLLTAAERHQLLTAGSPEPAASDRGRRPLSALFEAQVDRTPEAPAVSMPAEGAADGVRLTYRELDARANRLARWLVAAGVVPGDRVALCLERSPEMVVALLGVLKAGAAYVPLDPSSPSERLAFALEDSGAGLVLASAAVAEALPQGGVRVLLLDQEEPALARQSGERLGLALDPELPAYVIYTSGSTGRPKGVIVPHGNVARLFSATEAWFGFSADDVWTLFHSYAFDFSVWEIWGALLYGGRLVVVPWAVSRDPAAFRRLLEGEGVTVLSQTPSAFRQLMPSPPAPLPRAGEGSTAKAERDLFAVHPSPARGRGAGGEGSLRWIVFGGEALDPTMLQPWLDRHGDERPRLVNMYGITETTVHVTFRPLTRADAARPASWIGRPIPDLSVHVLDRHLELQPLGIPGEICVGGAGLAQGYLGRPDLTAARFVPDPFGPPGARLYRSGDLARRWADGDLEALGRIDHQVKIRGFRIEPGEIEAALAALPGVREAVVLARPQGGSGELRLVAYVTGDPDRAPALAGMREALGRRLPDYMIPSALVVLDRLPLTANGKVDRHALPDPEAAPAAASDRPSVPPRDRLEAHCASLFRQVLAVPAEREIGVLDDFFELGGSSISGAILINRLQDALGATVPVAAIFDHPTVEALSAYVRRGHPAAVERLWGSGAPAEVPAAEAPLVPVPRSGSSGLPLSFAQQRLWFLDRLLPGSPAYNIATFFRLVGRLDPPLLERVLGELARRHESLRTTFEERSGEAFQRIHPPAPVPLPRVDLDGLPEAVRAEEARRLAREEAGRGFDLQRGPLVRTALLRLGAEEHVLLTCLHHIVSDGWSTGVMAREVSVLYDAFRHGRPSPLPELPVQYADFAVWQRGRLAGEALESELAFWRQRLGDLPAVLELPTDRPRSAVRGTRGAVTLFRVGRELSEALAALGRRARTTPFMTLLAAFQVLLGRTSGQELFGLGTPIAGRTRLEIEPLIGFFVNTLVLRADLVGDPGFVEVLRRVRTESITAQAHQELPFEKLVEGLEIERSLSHTPLFQVMFAFQNAAEARLDLPGLSLLPFEVRSEIAKFDLGLTMGGNAEGLVGVFDSSTDLFDAPTIQRLARSFEVLLGTLVADPGRGIWQVPLLAPEEAHQLIVEWNDTRISDDAQGEGLHALIEAQAARRPERVAVELGGERLTYAGLVERARRQAEGIEPGSVVALAAERSPELIVSMLAVLRAGAAYLPIDPAYPEERRAFMLADSGARELKDVRDVKDVRDIKDPRDFKDRELAAPADLSFRSFTSFAESAAYIIYTSGSTGRPKGVAVPHRAITAFVRSAIETYAITSTDRVLQLASISFDTSAEEIWPTLAAGATLVLRTEEMASSIAHFLREAERLGITVLDLPTAFWHEMVDRMEAEGLELPRCVRLVILGGEEAMADRVAVWRARVGGGVRLVNSYGPTETTVAATCRDLSDFTAGGPVPIGRPIPGVQTYVLDRSLAPVPPNVRGELWIGGLGMARGYLGRPDLTAERFLPDPFAGVPGARLYRTGDLAVLRPDGDLLFAGRADRQIKIRGYRVELGEIEAALRGHPAVREALVVVREDGAGDRSLAACLVTAAGIEAPRWREWLAERLPGFMVPAAFVEMESLPLTPSGKVDRRALARIVAERRTGGPGNGRVAPRTPAEETLAGLFVEVLGAERTGGRIGIHDGFFDLGGHSLLATRLVAAIRDAFGIDLPLRLLFERPTVEGLARAVSEASESRGTGAGEEPIVALPRVPGGSRFPVSFSQLREWILDRLEPGNPAYNISNHLRIEGPLAVPVLVEALQALVRRHEVFRTRFEAGEEEPLQAVLPEVPLEVPVIDLSVLPAEERESELRRRVREEGGTGFDLSVAPLLRVRVVRLGAADHALLMTVHHIISDGWSMGILNQELAALYEGAPLPPLPVQYADYAVWLRRRLDGEGLERQAAFWKQRLAGAPPLLDLPTDRPRPPVRSSRGGRIEIHLPQPLAGRLEELARRRGATLFMVLLAGFQTLLGRWSGQEDVVVGTYSGDRPRREVEGLIGFFINTLVLRTGLAGVSPFAVLIDRVREATLEAYAHRDVPFEKLLEILQLPRDPSRTPLFQALLVLQNFPPTRVDLSTGVRLSDLPIERAKSDYDLALWLGEGPDGIAGMLEHSTDLFDRETMARFASQLRTLLEAAVADPDRDVWTLPLIGEKEQARQLAAWSRGPAVPWGEDQDKFEPLLHRLIEEQAARTPAAVALEAGSVRLSYAELVGRASDRARHLREQGIGPGSIVALAAERSPDLIVDMLAVLQVGAAYLPIDPAYPRERQAYMLGDSGAKDVRDLKDVKDVKDVRDVKDSQGSSSFESFESFGSLTSFTSFSPESAAYVIYTSGSTGRPKGVVVSHGAIASFVRGARESYGLGPGDRVLQFASISFDTSAEEIWPALASGATLVLRPEEMAASIPHFLRELGRLGITVLDLPTAFWHEMATGMAAEGLEPPEGLRLVILGGEEALADRLALWQARVGTAVRLVNTYGPTETTIVATRRELADLSPGGTVPIGRPVPGARACVLDRFFAPVPPGVRGELWIGGAGVARGYLGRPELTAERFVPDPFAAEPGARLYRTGDLAVLRPDGDLVFAGRADRQLKIRGYRIEPGEIEAALRLHPAVRDAVVDVRGPRDVQRLVAWIVPREGGEAPGGADLREFLRGRLPEPLLPAAYVPLLELPLTPSGKVDRRALPEPTEARPDHPAHAEPQSALERAIAEIYRDLLRVGQVGLHDNFFDLGGHSLLIVRAHQKLKAALGREIPVLDLFRFPTVAALARHLGGEETGQLEKVKGLAEQQRAAQQRQRAAMERLRSRR